MCYLLVIRRSRVRSPSRPATFNETDREIFSTAILFHLLIQQGQLSVSGERMCTSTGQPPAQEMCG